MVLDFQGSDTGTRACQVPKPAETLLIESWFKPGNPEQLNATSGNSGSDCTRTEAEREYKSSDETTQSTPCRNSKN